VKIYKHRNFGRWANSEKLTDNDLKRAVEEINMGLDDGNLGGGLYKKRVAIQGKGKRGGYRTLLAFKQGERAFFVYGYAKNERANINIKELTVYKKLSRKLLGMEEKCLDDLLIQEKLIEVK